MGVMTLRIALSQMDPRLGDKPKNLDRIERTAREEDADLVVFPECATAGYGYGDLESAFAQAEEIPGPTTDMLQKICADTGRHLVVGLLEKAEGVLFNSAVLLGPEGVIGHYRKMHLPHLGVDRFCMPGDLGFPVWEAPFGWVSMQICFDLSFPEAARCAKLGGAQLLVVPTNWPEQAQVSSCLAPPVRAQENHFFVATCNRVGEESGFTFRGNSGLYGCRGEVLVQADHAAQVIRGSVELSEAEDSRDVIIDGEYEIDRLASRRPLFYNLITTPRRKLPGSEASATNED